MDTNVLAAGGAVLIILAAGAPGFVLIWQQHRSSPRMRQSKDISKGTWRQVDDEVITDAAMAWARENGRPEAAGLVARKLHLGLRLTAERRARSTRRRP